MITRAAVAALLVFSCVPIASAGDAATGTVPSRSAGSAPAEPAAPLEDVVVTPRRSIFDEQPGERLLLGSEIEKLPLIDNDLFRALQEFPGITGGDYSARFGVRGGESDETLVLLDGMELFEPFHLQDFGGALSIIDMLAVSKAEFYPGAYPAEFGDSLSAVLDVRARRPGEDFRADAGMDLLNAHALVEAGQVLAVARAGYLGLLMGMMDSEESFNPHYGDLFLKWQTGADDGNEISANALLSADTNRIENPGAENDVRSRYDNALVWGSWRAKLSEEASIRSFLYGGWATRHRREGPTGLDDRDLRYAGAKTILDASPMDGLSVKAGLDARWAEGRYHYRPPASDLELETLASGTSLKGFLSGRLELSSAWTATAGARLLALGPREGTHAAPSAALSYHPDRSVEIRGAWGVYYQPVDPLHLPVEAGATETREPERAVHYGLGVTFRSREAKAAGGFDLYYQKRDRLAGVLLDSGRRSQVLWPRTSGRTSGMEVYLDKGLGDVVFHSSFTYSFSRERFQGREYWSDQDQRYAFRAGLSGSLGLGWTIYTGWKYHSGTPYTRMRPDNGVLVTIERNGGRLPPYHSLDLRIGKTWEVEGSRVQVYLQILNLYNRANVHEYSWTEKTEGGVTSFEREAEPLFPILPTMGINIEF